MVYVQYHKFMHTYNLIYIMEYFTYSAYEVSGFITLIAINRRKLKNYRDVQDCFTPANKCFIDYLIHYTFYLPLLQA